MTNKLFFKIGNKNDFNKILVFYKKFYPNSGWDINYLNWEFLKNPFGHAKIFLAMHKSKLVGITTGIPIKMEIGNNIFKGFRIQNVLTDINYRGQGIFSNLLRNSNYYLDNNSDFNITFPNKNSYQFFVKSNWTVVNKIPLFEKRLKNIEKIKINYEIISKFKIEHQIIWKKNLRKNLDVMCNTKYLNWRFINNPKSKYYSFNMISKKKLIGFIILKQYIDEQGFKIGHVCKVVCPERYFYDSIKFANNYFLKLSFHKISLWDIYHHKKLLDLRFKKIDLGELKYLFRTKKKINGNRWLLSMSQSDVF